jgi:uncharacterized protein (TIGR00251 family)
LEHLRKDGVLSQDSNSSFGLSIKAIPNASKNAIVGWVDSSLKVKIAAVPKGGKANRVLIKFLKQVVKPESVHLELYQGASSRLKSIRVTGISKEAFEKRIQAYLAK